MKIKYKSTLDDIIAFHTYHHSQSPLIKKGFENGVIADKLTYFFIGLLVCLVFVLLAVIFNTLFTGCVGVAIFIMVLICIINYKPKMEDSSKNNNRAFYTEKPEYEYDDVDNLELTDEGVQAKSGFDEALFFYNGFSNICSNDDYYFVYLRNVNAIIIPRDSIIEGNVDAFIEELQKRLDASKK